VIDGLKASHPTPESGVVAREQAALDRIMAGAFNDPKVDPYQRFGLVPAHPQAVAWITHVFLHSGWLALLANLFLLYLVAPLLEAVWGRPLFTGLYLLAGIVAAGAFVATHKSSDGPLVGAAGAVAGCFGAFAAHYRLSRCRSSTGR
jgi:membrane associated rhomboid family serine protease